MKRLRDRLLLAFVPLILLLIGATYLIQRNMVARLEAELQERLQRSSLALDAFNKDTVKRLNGQLRQMNESIALANILGEYFKAVRDSNDGARSAADKEKLADLESTIRLDVGQTEAKYADLDLLAVVDMEGRLVASIHRRADRKEMFDATTDDAKVLAAASIVKVALEKARQGDNGSGSCYMVLPDGQLYMVAAKPLFVTAYPEGALVVGTSELSIAFRNDVIFADSKRVLTAPTSLGTAQRGEIERDFLPTFHPPPADPPWNTRSPFVPTVIPMRIGDREFYTAPCPLWEVGRAEPVAWAFFVQSVDNLLGPARESRSMVVQVAVPILLLVVVMAVGVAGRITRPIEELSKKMRRVGEGFLDHEATVAGRDEVAQLATSFNQMVDGLREKERLAAYVPEKARDAIADVKGRHALGAQRVFGSVLFSDLRGFTAMSERLDPADVVAVLNEYLERMQYVVQSHYGYVSDYIGDAIVAVFTEPGQSLALSASLAVAAALHMQEALARLRNESLNPHVRSLHMGIGINTGLLVEGDVGPRARLKYAVMGDTVNVAARIQDRSKEGRHSFILVSCACYEHVKGEFDAVLFGSEMLKGKSTPIEIWEIIGRK